ncbi:PDZ domain-containing protein [Roseiconus nitratireducens]
MKTTTPLRRICCGISGTSAAVLLAMTVSTAAAQDSVRDRLSPGNGSDYLGNESQNADGTIFNETITPPAADQAWYRNSDGRFYYQDGQGNSIYEDQIYGPRQTGQNAGQGQRLRLGVALQDAQDGIRIRGIRRGSAAERAGLQAGDVITAMRGQRVSSASQFTRSVLAEQPGTELPLTIMRDGQSQEIQATLGGGSDRVSVSRPAMNDDASAESGLRQQVEQLQQQVNQMQQDLRELQGNRSGSESESANGPESADRSADGNASETSAQQNEARASERAAANANDAAENASEAAEDTVEEASDEVNRNASSAASEAREAASDAADSAADAANDAAEAVSDQQ